MQLELFVHTFKENYFIFLSFINYPPIKIKKKIAVFWGTRYQEPIVYLTVAWWVRKECQGGGITSPQPLTPLEKCRKYSEWLTAIPFIIGYSRGTEYITYRQNAVKLGENRMNLLSYNPFVFLPLEKEKYSIIIFYFHFSCKNVVKIEVNLTVTLVIPTFLFT